MTLLLLALALHRTSGSNDICFCCIVACLTSLIARVRSALSVDKSRPDSVQLYPNLACGPDVYPPQSWVRAHRYLVGALFSL